MVLKTLNVPRKLSSSVGVKSFTEIPGPLNIPIWGSLYLYKLGIFNVFKYHKVLQHLHKKYGPIVKERLGFTTVVHVFDPEDVRHIYQNEDKMPYVVPLQETTQLYRQQTEMSLGLGNTNGEQWYKLRNAVRHLMLRPRDVQQFLPNVESVADDFVERLKQKRNIRGIVPDLKRELGKWSQESAGTVCYDKRLGYLAGGDKEQLADKVIDANRDIFYLSGLLKFSLPIYKYLSSVKWNKLVEAEEIVVKTANKYTAQAVQTIAELVAGNKLKPEQFIFLRSLLGKSELSDKDIAIITFSLFMDGLSTTVPSMQHNLYCLSINPDIQEKAYQEVSTVLGNKTLMTVDDLNHLSYIKAIVKETFRMYPNGTEISRIIQKDLVLSGYLVPAQTSVSINMGVHFESDVHFSDPLTFKPERWLRDGGGKAIHPFLLTPFGHGTRTCAGRRFAEQDMYVLLSKIVKNFRLKYAGDKPMELVYNTLLMPEKPLEIEFIPR